MRFAAVAIDYDGTLATEGAVHPTTVAALEEVVASGRKFILVTGRMLRELLPLFPQATLCARIVAENGAVLYHPSTKDQRLLTHPASASLIEVLRRKGVPLDIGESIIATVRPHEVPIMEAIRDLGLEHHVIFNRESVMVLPPGVNKATGLAAALDELQLSPHEVVGIGDSENDHALFQASELAVAVASAVPTLREAADWITSNANGTGTTEALLALVADDMAEQAKRMTRHHIVIGSGREPFTMAPVGENLLIAGTSGSGKSTLAHAILEQLIDQGYQTCVIDPEGDYPSMEKMIVFGNSQRGPTVAEVVTALENPKAQVIVNLVGLPLEDRPAFFLELLPKLQELRLRSGRPHRIVVDEAHHLLPKTWTGNAPESSRDLKSMLFVTVHPDRLSPQLIDSIELAVALGHDPAAILRFIAGHHSRQMPAPPTDELKPGEALLWRKGNGQAVECLLMAVPRVERQRHRRKYAEGELPPERSFYFRGPDGKLNLRAQNLIMFRQIADGVDDATWLHHLRQGDYSHWLETAIKDPSLARIVQEVEGTPELSARDSRRRVASAIEDRYTLPATGA